MRRSHALPEWWKRFWFATGSAHRLAMVRIVIAGHALWVLLSRDLPAMSGLPAEFWSSVPVSTQWRYLLFHGQSGAEYAVQAGALVALVAALLGIVPRLTCLVAGVLLYHLAPLEAIIWTDTPYERGFEVAILSLVVLGLSPCGDAWAVRLGRKPAPPRAPWEYSWPVRLVQLFVVQIYFFAGYAKLYRVGLEWISAGNLRGWFLAFTQYEEVAVFTALGRFMADRPALLFCIALGTVVFELAFPLVLFSRIARRTMIPLAVLLHVGILFSMNIVFLNAPQLLVFVNWDWVRRRVSRLTPALERDVSPAPG